MSEFAKEAPRTSEWIEKYGGYNDFPPGWKEISEAEFSKSRFWVYEPKYYEYRQMGRLVLGGEPLFSARLFFMSTGEGYGIHSDWRAGKIRYFRFGCSHEWREMSRESAQKQGIYHPGRCYHVCKCVLCAAIWAYDSSD